MIVGIGAMAVLFDTVVAAHLQVSADASMRGRVLGAATVASAASGVVGAPALGGLAQLLNGRAALGVGGAICLTTVAVATNVYAGRASTGGPIELLRRARSRRGDHAGAPAPLSASTAGNG
jgi:hypothetical protein